MRIARIPGRRAPLRLGLLALVAPGLVGGKEVGAGAYCRLPENDEAPRACLGVAQAEYTAFFSGLSEGKVNDAAASQVEAALRDGGEHQMDALSSLVYAYYLLSRRAAATDGPTDPAVVARLEGWNNLLVRAYNESGEDATLRSTLQEAALDLQQRAPAIRLTCTDASGHRTPCDSTDAIVRAIGAVRDESGLRGALGRWLERLFGEDERPVSATDGARR